MAQETITLYKATLADINLLQDIGRKTFQESFADSNTEENMQLYLQENFSLEKLATEINHPDSEFYIATHNHTAIGYIKLNFSSAQTELKDKQAIEIERIYVLSEFYGKKIGQRLYHGNRL